MTIDGGRVVVRLEGKDINLSQLITKIEKEMKGAQQGVSQFDSALTRLTASEKRAQSETLAYATALSRAEAASGNYAGAIQRLAGAITQISPNTVAGANAIANLQTQISKYEARIDATATKNRSFVTNLAAGFNQLVGAGFALQGIGNIFGDLITSGNNLEKIDATVRALAGSQEKYNEVLGIARQQQDQFGGSLQENLENLSGFIYTANQAGVSVDKLANIARRLAIIDPVQGFKGASIALKEFFSGDITSLARRFEIPRDTLNGIKNIADEAERLKALDAVLTDMGLGMELLESQANTTAVTYDKLVGSFQDLFATVGQGVASILAPAAEKLTQVFQFMADGLEQLGSKDDQMASLQAQLLTQVTTVEQYNAKIAEMNAIMDANDPLLGAVIGRFQELTAAELSFLQAQIAMGASADEAYAKLQGLANGVTFLENAFGNVGTRLNESTESITAFNNAGVNLTLILNDGGARAMEYADAVALGRLTADEAAIAMNNLAGYTLVHRQATADATAAEEEFVGQVTQAIAGVGMLSQEVASDTFEKLNNKVASEQAAYAQELLYSLAEQAATGMISSSQAASILAGQLGIATSEAYGLINALSQLKLAQAAAATKTSGLPASYYQAATGSSDPLKFKELQDARKAELEYQYAVGTTSEKLALRQRELNNTKKGTADYFKALTDVTRLEQQLATEQEKAAKKAAGGSGGGKTKKTAAQKENEDRLKDEQKLRDDLLDVQADYNEKAAEEEKAHYEKLAEIYADYAEAQQQAITENETSKRRGRADFYAALNPADNEGIDVGQFASQYEQAFAEAQRIAQEGKAKLSQEFLELRQEQIQEMLDLEKQISDVRNDKNLSERDKKAQIEYLQGLKKLYEDAQAEELKQLLEGGDENANKLNEQLSAEEKRYAEQTTKIAEEARKQADEKVKQAERGRLAILEENKALQAQYDLLKNITAAGGGPATTVVPPNAPTATAPATTAPIPVTQVNATDPNSVESAMFVKQIEVWRSYDEVVNGTINVVGARLEQRLTDVITAIDTSRDAIIRGLGAVEKAVGKSNSSSAVTR